MVNVHVLFRDETMIGVYANRANALTVQAALPSSQTALDKIVRVEVDYPLTQVQAGESLYLVQWSNITSANTRSTRQLSVKQASQLAEGDVTWDSRTRRFRVIVWNLTQVGAETEATAIRDAFITANNL